MNSIVTKTQQPEMPSVFQNTDLYQQLMMLSSKLAASTIIPKDFQNSPANCFIALDMANRLNAAPMMIMQNLYVINGRPAWSAQWLVAMINRSHKYKTELQYEIGHDKADGGLSCYAWAEDYKGHKVTGPKITMAMANAEGWTGKNGSKWKTMPEVMIRYRAASFFARSNCPDMVMGIYTSDEAREMEIEVKEPTFTSYEASDINFETGEITMQAETSIEPETADFGFEKKISESQRKELFEAIKASGVGDPNETLRTLLDAYGYTSTRNLPVEIFEKVMLDIQKLAENEEPEETGEENE